MAANPILGAALALAARRFPVFRLKAGQKLPDTPHGFKDAVTEPAEVAAMFAGSPNANVGIRTGAESNIAVLDVDPRHGGHVSLARFEALHGALPATVTCATGGGGRHLYFRHPGERLTNRAGVRPGLDVRGDGGYVVAPPSVHESGKSYAWEPGRAPGEIEIATLPPALLKLMTSRAMTVEQRAQKYMARCAPAMEGERNDAAFRVSGHLQKLANAEGDCLDEETVVALMRAWNASNQPPLEDEELLRCIENSAKHGTPPQPKEPRGDAASAGDSEGEGDEQTPKRGVTEAPLFSADGRPTLVVYKSALHRAGDECIRRLSREEPPKVFLHNGGLVVLAETLAAQPLATARPRARAHKLNDASLCEELNRRCQFLLPKVDRRTQEITYVPDDCPQVLARWILSRGEWPGLPNLTAILTAPTMVPSGDLVAQPGYHPASGIYLDIEVGEFPAIPDAPTEGQAKAAFQAYIVPLYEEFPFDGEPSRAAAISALFSAVSRLAFEHAPFHGFDAPTMASGKTLLAIVTGVVAQGFDPPSLAFSTNEEEMDKRLGSVLLQGRRVALIDNIQHPLGGDQLCSAITNSVVGIRLFHTQHTEDVPTWTTLWLGTGNNLSFDKDMTSRALRCRIDAKVENPAERTFKIANLREHALIHRPKIVATVLLCLRAYVVARRPKQAFKPLNRFEGWSDLIRSTLVWLGLGDPVETMVALGGSDAETDELAALLSGLRYAFGSAEFTAAAALQQTSLKELFDLVCPARSGVGHDPRRLGRSLQRGIGRVVGNLCLELASRPHNTNSYRVIETGGGSGGSGGTPLSASCTRTRAGAGACAHAGAHTHEEEVHVPRLDSQIPPIPPLPPGGGPGTGPEGSGTAPVVVKRRLKGHPPGSWDDLDAASESARPKDVEHDCGESLWMQDEAGVLRCSGCGAADPSVAQQEEP